MDNQQLALLITKALAYTENGGKPDVHNLSAGKSGEMKSMFQFLPSTWRLYAKQELGDANAPLTPENEALVVHKKVSDWVDHLSNEGVSQDEIPLKVASMWNAGESKPDAYKEGWKGTNSKGVSYDTPAYANKVASYVKEFEKEPSGQPQQQTSPDQNLAKTPQENTKLLNMVSEKLSSMGHTSQPMSVSSPAPSQPSGGLLQQLAHPAVAPNS